MTPPEIILDRWVKQQSRQHPLFANYVGKLDIERVNPPPVRTFLSFTQDAMNAALRLENANASGGVTHPPFHFDYIQVNGPIQNAHAFQHQGFSFIVVTFPLVQLLWDLSTRLSGSAAVQRLLQINPERATLEALQALLFQFQVTFLVSHEYTHHVHGHCNQHHDELAGIWTELFQEGEIGGLESQAQELDADGYAIYLVLANFVRGAARQGALSQLKGQDLPDVNANELLLLCFFVALDGLFCALWPETIPTESICKLRHPPAPVRIQYAMRVAEMWCAQNESVPKSWFDDEKFNALFLASTEAIGGTKPRAWDAHIAFLQSREGTKYDQLLFERYEALRKDRGESLSEAASATA